MERGVTAVHKSDPLRLLPLAEVSNRWPGFYEGAIHAANVAVANMTRVTLPTGVYRGRFATYREPSIKPHKANRRQMS